MTWRLFISILTLGWLSGCAIQPAPTASYAYGVRATDWVMEDEGLRCAQACHMVQPERRLECMANCPGFVIAEVESCDQVLEWNECYVAYAPVYSSAPNSTLSSTSPAAPTSDPRNRPPTVGETIAVGTLRILGAVITAALQNEANRSDDNASETHFPEIERAARSVEGRTTSKEDSVEADRVETEKERVANKDRASMKDKEDKDEHENKGLKQFVRWGPPRDPYGPRWIPPPRPVPPGGTTTETTPPRRAFKNTTMWSRWREDKGSSSERNSSSSFGSGSHSSNDSPSNSGAGSSSNSETKPKSARKASRRNGSKRSSRSSSAKLFKRRSKRK